MITLYEFNSRYFLGTREITRSEYEAIKERYRQHPSEYLMAGAPRFTPGEPRPQGNEIVINSGKNNPLFT
jgi:hypothetical protein